MSKNLEGKKGYSPHSAARILAVQAVYQAFMNEQALEDAAEEYLSFRLEVEGQDGQSVHADPKFFAHIVRGVAERHSDLSGILEAHLNKDPARLEPLLKAIFLCAAFELLADVKTDIAVVLDEYLDVTHSFFDGQEVKLVNGVLDKVAKSVRD